MGEDTWRDFPSWPPPGYAPQRLHLHPAGALAVGTPDESAPDTYRYGPADPTPALGGVRMAVGIRSGRVDDTDLEAARTSSPAQLPPWTRTSRSSER